MKRLYYECCFYYQKMVHINLKRYEHTIPYHPWLSYTYLSFQVKLKAHLPHEALLDFPSPYCSDLPKHVFKIWLWLLALTNVTWISKGIVAFGLDFPASILELPAWGVCYLLLLCLIDLAVSWIGLWNWCPQSCHFSTFCSFVFMVDEGGCSSWTGQVCHEVLKVHGKWGNSRVCIEDVMNFSKHYIYSMVLYSVIISFLLYSLVLKHSLFLKWWGKESVVILKCYLKKGRMGNSMLLPPFSSCVTAHRIINIATNFFFKLNLLEWYWLMKTLTYLKTKKVFKGLSCL